LSPDGLWRQHSWATEGKKILETTKARSQYFGYLLTPAEAEEFWRAENGQDK